ncbi:hypothetical protein [Bounagaea algeriensis]
MNSTQIGLLAGLVLGTAAVAGGFVGFLVALVIGLVGLVIGRMVDGEVEFGDLWNRVRGRSR